jgi:hypothetical protein
MIKPKDVIIPFSFDPLSYLKELTRQMPRRNGADEIGRQLARAIGRENPYLGSYVYNLAFGFQPMSKAFIAALWLHKTYIGSVEGLQGKTSTEISTEAIRN